MPTTLPVRSVYSSAPTSLAAVIACGLAFAIVILLTFDAPSYDQIGTSPQTSVETPPYHRI